MTRAVDDLRALVERSLRNGDGGQVACALFSDGVERLVEDAFARARSPAGVAVLAQGGLARRELAPRADVDLLVVVEEHGRAEVEQIFYPLWDAGLVLGHAVRTPADVEDAVRKDHHAATALLEARFVCGDVALAGELYAHVVRRVLPPLRERLTAQKLDELEERRARFGGSVHLVEPNVKSSPGGLRDIHSALWLGLLRASPGDTSGKDALSRLLEIGLVFEREAEALKRARDTLLGIRAGLHLVAGRAEDRLLFQHQAPIAELMGVVPKGDDETANEALMRLYFRAALLARRTVDDVIERLMLSGDRPLGVLRELDDSFRAAGRQLFTADAELFARQPARMIEAVQLADEHGLRLSPRTRSRMYAAVASAGDSLLDDEACARALYTLAQSHKARDAPFTELLECGVLGAVLRDMRRLEGRFKHDGYHAYTVDAHLCRVTDMALRVASGVERPPEPLAPSVARTSRFHLLVLGALFHDMGKGLGGDHAVLGAAIAMREAQRMGLPPEDRDILRFLVEEHLMLSQASQRRDLTDPAVIDDVARRVQTPERLDLLALLTWADMSGVAPGTFTDWKGRLLGLAVERVRALLLEPEESRLWLREHDAEVRRRARDSLAAIAPDDVIARFVDGASVRAIASRLEDALVEDLVAFAEYDVESEQPVVSCAVAEGGHAHSIRVVCPDRRGLLADLARALSSHGANILHAHADARDDGIGFDAFRVDDGRGRALHEEALEHAMAALYDAARGETVRAVLPMRFVKKSGPRIEPRVRVVEGSDSWGATVVELRGEDRPGLIAELARTVSSLGWSIVLAKVSTEGAVARDVFYVVRERPNDDGADEGGDGDEGESAAARDQLRDALHACLLGAT